ncbi:MAG: hypothetical protein Q4B22_07140 [Eubacteriales bacterium]|nr:hypothetical protein [Eubacteriales bacterium]
MRIGKVLSLAMLTAAVVVGVNLGANTVSADSADTVTMYRMYNPNSGEHFYTGNVNEKESLLNIGWWCEGTGWIGPKSSNTPVYRMYNPNAGDHHYTTNARERDHLVSVGWNYEGIGWYSADKNKIPVYREYNPNAVTGAHNYTTSASEDKWLESVGWSREGIGWYAGKAGKAYSEPEIRVYPEDQSGQLQAMDFLEYLQNANEDEIRQRFGKPDSMDGAGHMSGPISLVMRYNNVTFGAFSGTLILELKGSNVSPLRVIKASWYLNDPSQSAAAFSKLRNGFLTHGIDANLTDRSLTVGYSNANKNLYSMANLNASDYGDRHGVYSTVPKGTLMISGEVVEVM